MTYSSQATTSILPQSDSTGTSRHRLNRDWKGLIICLSIAFLLRAFLIWRNPQELVHDRDSYLGIARTIAQGAGYCTPDSNSPTAFRPPLYPVLLSILSQIASVPVVVASINLLFGLLMVLWTYEATKLLGCRRMALTAAFLVSIDPLIIVYSGQPMTEVTCAALISLLLLIGIRNQLVVQSRLSRCSSEHTSDPSGNDSQTPLEPSPSRFWLNELAFGGVFGLLVLCRPTFWPVAGIWLIGQIVKRFFTGCSDQKHAVCWAVILGTLIVVWPWGLRNWVVFGRPILTTTHGGYTLLLANNPVFYTEVLQQPWGAVWKGDSLSKWQAEINERILRELGPGASEVDQDRLQSQFAKEFIATHRSEFIRAAIYRFRSFWSPVPLGEAAENYSPGIIFVVGWYYRIIHGLFLVGLVFILASSERRLWSTALVLVFVLQSAHLVYWTNARMRAPLVPITSVIVASAVSRLIRRAEFGQNCTSRGQD